MDTSRLLDWKTRALVDGFTAVALIGIMFAQGAPAWALTLGFLIATRASRLALAADTAAVNVRLNREDTVEAR